MYERRSDMRKEKMAAGRSINLALSDRGLLALEKVGLAEEIKDIHSHAWKVHPQFGWYNRLSTVRKRRTVHKFCIER